MNAQQLRNSILQEAIEGRLVPQDPNDEPASALLERIREEKRRLVKEGKLKKKDLVETPISEEEKPFEIPESWVWVRLGYLCIRFSTGPFGTMVHKEDYVVSAGHPLVNPTNIKDGIICSDGIKMVSDDKYEELSSYVLKNDDFILARRGDLSKIAIVSKNEEGWLAGTGAFFMHFIGGIFLPFFTRLYSSTYCQSYLLAQSVGGTMNNLNQKLLADFLIPLPPLAEQKRIVAKIEELMPKVEEYGKAQEALDKLNAELPEKLKKSILQEAIEGRLVPQDPNDEPASVLLNKIRKEKAQLVKEGKLKKKDLVETPISEDEKPFEIPESWEWCRVSEISESFIGLTYKPSDVSETGWIVLRSSNIQNGKIDFKDIVRVNVNVPSKLHVQENDIIICARNGSQKLVGKSAIVKEVKEPMTFGAFMAICRTDFYQYMSMYLLSPLFFGQLRKDSGTTTINQLTQKNFNNYLVPLPPLAEQHRIVAKMEELFAEVEKLAL